MKISNYLHSPQINNLEEIRTLHFNQTVFNLKKTAPPEQKTTRKCGFFVGGMGACKLLCMRKNRTRRSDVFAISNAKTRGRYERGVRSDTNHFARLIEVL